MRVLKLLCDGNHFIIEFIFISNQFLCMQVVENALEIWFHHFIIEFIFISNQFLCMQVVENALEIWKLEKYMHR